MPDHRTTSRRKALAAGAAICLLGKTAPVRASLTVDTSVRGWRFCNKCQVLFKESEPHPICAAGGMHRPQGLSFRLPEDAPSTQKSQGRWAGCSLCQSLFYNGMARKGRCAANAEYTRDNGHEAHRLYRVALPHDVPPTNKSQDHWRFCNKCFALFYDGYPAKGKCPAGDAHVAQGLNFVLPHEG